jgi:iron(III) transport system permease protein
MVATSSAPSRPARADGPAPKRSQLVRGVSAVWTSALAIRLLIALALILLVVYPLVQLIGTTFGLGTGAFSVTAYTEAFDSPTFGRAVLGSLTLTVSSLIIGVPIAVALAWVIARSDAHLAGRLAALPTIALALSPLVGAIGWLFLLSPRSGMANVILRRVFGDDSGSGPFNSYSIIVIVLVLALYIVPYIYGPVYAALRQADGSTEEAARVCGSGNLSVFWRVTVPMLRPSILAGSLIGAVMAASMFAIPLILASGTGLQVIPVLIYQYMNSQNLPQQAAAIASVLSILTIVGMVLSSVALRRGSFASITAKGRVTNRVRLGRWGRVANAGVLVYIFLSFVFPLLGLVVLSLLNGWYGRLHGLEFTLQQYRTALAFPSAISSIWNSVWLSALGACVALTLGITVAYLRLRSAPRLGRLLSWIGTLPVGVPGIVYGLAILLAFSGSPFNLYGTAGIMLIGYVALVIPVAVRNAEASLRQISPELEEAALSVGDSRAGLIARIVLPLMRHSVVSTWGLMFLMLFRDLNLSILLYSLGTSVASVSLIGIYGQGNIGAAAAYAIVMTSVSGLAAWLVVWLPSRGSRTARVDATAAL